MLKNYNYTQSSSHITTEHKSAKILNSEKKTCTFAIICYDNVCKNVSVCAEFVLVACSRFRKETE